MLVLIAGGAGCIGSHTCKAMTRAGHAPIGYDNLGTGHSWLVKWVPLDRCDINEPVLYFRANTGGIITLLEAMRMHDVSSIVFSSSCATYGVQGRLPIIQIERQAPINPHGRSKAMAKDILRDAWVTHGLAVVPLRYFSAADADPQGELGDEHDPKPHLIPAVLQGAACLRPGVRVFGTGYDTPNPACMRDYVHVADLAAAHVSFVPVGSLRGLQPREPQGRPPSASCWPSAQHHRPADIRGGRTAVSRRFTFADGGRIARRQRPPVKARPAAAPSDHRQRFALDHGAPNACHHEVATILRCVPWRRAT